MAEADTTVSRLATAEDHLAAPSLVNGRNIATPEAGTMEQSSPKVEGQEHLASFKGQMAARYKERQSMGFHITQSEKQGEDVSCVVHPSEEIQRDDLPKAARRMQSGAKEAAGRESLRATDVPKQSISLGVQGNFGGKPDEYGEGRLTVQPRRSMKDLITQFERRSSTALGSLQCGPRASTSSGESGKTATAQAAERAGGSLARVAWRGSNRAIHMELDTAAETSSSSSASFSEESEETESLSFRDYKRCARRIKGGKFAKILRSASSTDLETAVFGVSNAAGGKEARNKKGRGCPDGKGLEVFAGMTKAGLDAGLSEMTHAMKSVGRGGDQASGGAPENVDLGPENTDKKDTECEFGQSEQIDQGAVKEQTTDTQTQNSEVPQPLRVNLKDFAARKKRSSNTGDMKYIVHRKDWNKWMQNQHRKGARQKQPGGLLEAASPSEPKSLERTRKSALDLKFLRKTGSYESKPESVGFRGASRASGKRKVSTSASNTQQRLERRISKKIPPSPAVYALPVGRTSRTISSLKKPSGAMERYQMFLNQTSRHGKDLKSQTEQRLQAESHSSQNSPSASVPDLQTSQFGLSEAEGSGPHASVTFPGFSLPPSTLSPRKRIEGSRQTLQALLQKTRDKDLRQQQASTCVDNDERGYQSTLSLKPDVSDGMTLSTVSFISNANTTSTMELEQNMDRVLAQLEEVTAAKALRNSAFERVKQGNLEIPSVNGQPMKDLNKWKEKSHIMSRLSPTSKMLNSVTRESNTGASGMLKADLKECHSLGTDSPLTRHGSAASKQPLSLPSNTAREYLHQLSFHSTSPWMRKAPGSHSLRESRSRSSPARVRQLANAYTLSTSESSKLGQQLTAQTSSLEGQKTNHASSGQWLPSAQFQSHSNRHKSTLPIRVKHSPSFGTHAVTRLSVSDPNKPSFSSQYPWQRPKISKVVPQGQSPTTTDLSRPFLDSSKKSESLIRIISQAQGHKDTTLSEPTKYAKKTGLQHQETNMTELAKELQSEPEKLNTKQQGTAPSEVSKSLIRSNRRAPFLHENGEYKNKLRDGSETIQAKTNGSTNQYVGFRAAAKSKSIHTGLWNRSAALSTTNARNKSPQYQQTHHWGGSTNTGCMREAPMSASDEKCLPQQRPRWPSSNFLTHSQLSLSNAKAKTASHGSTQPSTVTKTANLSPGGEELSTVSSKSGRSYLGSPKKAAAESEGHPAQTPVQRYQRSNRRTRSIPTATRTSSVSSMLSRDRIRKTSGSRHITREEGHGKLPENSVDEVSTVGTKAPVRKKTLASTSKVDHTLRKTATTSSTGALDAEAARGLTKVRTMSSSSQDIPKDVGDCRSNEPAAERKPGEGARNLGRWITEPKDSLSPVKMRSLDTVLRRDDSVDGWTGLGESGQINSELKNNVFCHFGSSDHHFDDKASPVGSQDHTQDSSSPETYAVKRKRKLVQKMKKIKKKMKRKREEEIAVAQKEAQIFPGLTILGESSIRKDNQRERHQQQQHPEMDKKAAEYVDSRRETTDLSPKSTVSRKLTVTPESIQAAGVTSVTIHKRSISRSPPKMMRPVKLPKYRPVTRLTNKPTRLFPTFSHIPLRMYSPDFLSNRKRLDLLAQYRRWRDGMVDPEHPSRIPLSIGFRWTLNSAVVEEWALHCWEPDSGVYMDEQGTWWSSVTDTPDGVSVQTSIFADTCVCCDTPVEVINPELSHTYGHASTVRQIKTGDGSLVMPRITRPTKALNIYRENGEGQIIMQDSMVYIFSDAENPHKICSEQDSCRDVNLENGISCDIALSHYSVCGICICSQQATICRICPEYDSVCGIYSQHDTVCGIYSQHDTLCGIYLDHDTVRRVYAVKGFSCGIFSIYLIQLVTCSKYTRQHFVFLKNISLLQVCSEHATLYDTSCDIFSEHKASKSAWLRHDFSYRVLSPQSMVYVCSNDGPCSSNSFKNCTLYDSCIGYRVVYNISLDQTERRSPGLREQTRFDIVNPSSPSHLTLDDGEQLGVDNDEQKDTFCKLCFNETNIAFVSLYVYKLCLRTISRRSIIEHSSNVLALDVFHLFEVNSCKNALSISFCAVKFHDQKANHFIEPRAIENQLMKKINGFLANQILSHILSKYTSQDDLLPSLDSNNNSSHLSDEQYEFSHGMSRKESTFGTRLFKNHLFPTVSSHSTQRSVIARKSRIHRLRKFDHMTILSNQSDDYLLLAISSLLDLPCSDQSTRCRADVPLERNNNSGGSHMGAKDLYTERSVTCSTHAHSRAPGTACASRYLGHVELEPGPNNWMEKLHTRRTRRNMRPRPWKDPIATNDNQCLAAKNANISKEMETAPRLHEPKDILNFQNIGTTYKERTQVEQNADCSNPTRDNVRNSPRRTCYRKKSFAESLDLLNACEPRYRFKPLISPNAHGHTLSKNLPIHNVNKTNSQFQGSRPKLSRARGTDEAPTPEKIHLPDPFSHIKAKVECRMPPKKEIRSPKSRPTFPAETVSKSWLNSFVDGYEQLRRGSRRSCDGRTSHLQEQFARKVEEVILKKAQAIVKSYQEFLESQSYQYKSDAAQSQAANTSGEAGSRRHEHLDDLPNLQHQGCDAEKSIGSDDTRHKHNVNKQDVSANISENEMSDRPTPEKYPSMKPDEDCNANLPQSPKVDSHGLAEEIWIRKVNPQLEQMFSLHESDDLDWSTRSFTMSSFYTNGLPQPESLVVNNSRNVYEIPSNYVRNHENTTNNVIADCASSCVAWESLKSSVEKKSEEKHGLYNFPTLRACNWKKSDGMEISHKSKIPILQKRKTSIVHHSKVGKDIEEEKSTINKPEIKHRKKSEKEHLLSTCRLHCLQLDETPLEKCSNHARSTCLKKNHTPHKPYSAKPNPAKPQVDITTEAPWWRRSEFSNVKEKRRPLARGLNVSLNKCFKLISEKMDADDVSTTYMLPSARGKHTYQNGSTDKKFLRKTKTKYTKTSTAPMVSKSSTDGYFSPFGMHDPMFEPKDLCDDKILNKLQSQNSLQSYLLSFWDEAMDNTRDQVKITNPKRYSPKPFVHEGRCKKHLPGGASVSLLEPSSTAAGSVSSSWLSGSEAVVTSHTVCAGFTQSKHCKKLQVGLSPPKQPIGTPATTLGDNFDDGINERLSNRLDGNEDGASREQPNSPRDSKKICKASSADQYDESAAYQSSLSTLRSISDLPYNNQSPVENPSSVFARHSSPLGEKLTSAPPSKIRPRIKHVSPIEKIDAKKQLTATRPRYILKKEQIRDTPLERRCNFWYLKNINYSNIACRISISEPNLTTDSGKPSHSSLRKCLSYLNISNISSSTSTSSFNASKSYNTCYFSGVSVHGDVPSYRETEYLCPNKSNEKRRSIFTRLGAGDCLNEESSELTFHRMSCSNSAEFWSEVSSETRRPELLNTCYNNSPNKRRLWRSNLSNAILDKMAGRASSKGSRTFSYDLRLRRCLRGRERARQRTPDSAPWKLLLKRRNAKDQKHDLEQETSPVSIQSFTSLLKFWERASKTSPKFDGKLSFAKVSSSKSTKRPSKTAIRHQRRRESSEQAVTKTAIQKQSSDLDTRVSLNQLLKMESHSKNSSERRIGNTPYPLVQVNFTGQLPVVDGKLDKCFAMKKKSHRKGKKSLRKLQNSIMGKSNAASPVPGTPKRDKMSIIYDLKHQATKRGNQYNLSKQRNGKDKESPDLERRSSSASGRTLFHSAISAHRHSPAKQTTRAPDLTCSDSVEAFRQQRLLDFIATCCRSQKKSGHSAGSSDFIDDSDTRGGVDTQDSLKSLEKTKYRIHMSHPKKSAIRTLENFSNHTENKKEEFIKCGHNDDESAKLTNRKEKLMTKNAENMMQYSAQREIKANISPALSKRFEPCLRVGKSPTKPSPSPGTGGSKNAINMSPCILNRTPQIDLNNTVVLPQELTNKKGDMSSPDVWIHKEKKQELFPSKSPPTFSSAGKGYVISTGLDCSSDSSGVVTPKNTIGLRDSSDMSTVSQTTTWTRSNREHSRWKRNQRSNLTFIRKPQKREPSSPRAFTLGKGQCSTKPANAMQTTESTNIGYTTHVKQNKAKSSTSRFRFSVHGETAMNPLHQHLKSDRATFSTIDSEDTFVPSLETDFDALTTRSAKDIGNRMDTFTPRNNSSSKQDTKTFRDGSDSCSYSKTATSADVSDLHPKHDLLDSYDVKTNTISNKDRLVLGESKDLITPDQKKSTCSISGPTETFTINAMEKQITPSWINTHTRSNKNSVTQTEALDGTRNLASSMEKTVSSAVDTETVGTQTTSCFSSEKERDVRADLSGKDQRLERAFAQKTPSSSCVEPHGFCDDALLAQNLNLRPLKTVAFETATSQVKSDTNTKSRLGEQPGTSKEAFASFSAEENYSKGDETNVFLMSQKVCQGQEANENIFEDRLVVKAHQDWPIKLHCSPLDKVKLRKVQKVNSDTDVSYSQRDFARKESQIPTSKYPRPVEFTDKLTEDKTGRSNKAGKLFKSLISPTFRDGERRDSTKKRLSKHVGWQKYAQPINPQLTCRKEDGNRHFANSKIIHSCSDSDLLTNSSFIHSLTVCRRAFILPRTQEIPRSSSQQMTFSTSQTHVGKHMGDKNETFSAVEICRDKKEDKPNQDDGATREDSTAVEGKGKLATQDIEIVLGDDVTVREFMKCFIGGLDFEINDSGNSILPTPFSLIGRTSRNNKGKPSCNTPGQRPHQIGDDDAPAAVGISSCLNRSRNHNLTEAVHDPIPAPDEKTEILEEKPLIVTEDGKKTLKKEQIQSSNQDAKHLENEYQKISDNGTKGLVIDDIEAAVDGFVTGILKRKCSKAEGKKNNREKKTRKALHEELMGATSRKATSPQKPTRYKQRNRSPSRKTVEQVISYESVLQHISDAKRAWWERSAMTKPSIAKATSKPRRLQKVQEKRKMPSSRNRYKGRCSETCVTPGDKRSSTNKMSSKRDNSNTRMQGLSSGSETATVFWSSPHLERRMRKSPQRNKKNGHLIQNLKPEDSTLLARHQRHKSKLSPDELDLKNGTTFGEVSKSYTVVNDMSKVHVRRSKSTSDIDTGTSVHSVCRSFKQENIPENGCQETSDSDISPRKSSPIINMSRSTRMLYSPNTHRQSRQNAKRGYKKKYRSRLSPSPVSPEGLRKKKVKKAVSTKNGSSRNKESAVKQKRKTLSEKLMEKEFCDLGKPIVPDTVVVQKSDENEEIQGGQANSPDPHDRRGYCARLDRLDGQQRFESPCGRHGTETAAESNDIYPSYPASSRYNNPSESTTRAGNDKNCCLFENDNMTQHDGDIPKYHHKPDLPERSKGSAFQALRSSKTTEVWTTKGNKTRFCPEEQLVKTIEYFVALREDDPTNNSLSTYSRPMQGSVVRDINTRDLNETSAIQSEQSSESTICHPGFDVLKSERAYFRDPENALYHYQPERDIISDDHYWMQSNIISSSSQNIRGNEKGVRNFHRDLNAGDQSEHRVLCSVHKKPANSMVNEKEAPNSEVSHGNTALTKSHNKTRFLSMTLDRQSREPQKKLASQRIGVMPNTKQADNVSSSIKVKSKHGKRHLTNYHTSQQEKVEFTRNAEPSLENFSKERIKSFKYKHDSHKPVSSVDGQNPLILSQAEMEAQLIEFPLSNASGSDVFQDVREPNQIGSSVVPSWDKERTAQTPHNAGLRGTKREENLPRKEQTLKLNQNMTAGSTALTPRCLRSPTPKRLGVPTRPVRRCDTSVTRRGIATDSIPVPKPRTVVEGVYNKPSLGLTKQKLHQQRSPKTDRTDTEGASDTTKRSLIAKDSKRAKSKCREKRPTTPSPIHETTDVDDIMMSLLLGKHVGKNEKGGHQICHNTAQNKASNVLACEEIDEDCCKPPLPERLGEDFTLLDLKNVIENTVKDSIDLYMKQVQVEAKPAAVSSLKVNETQPQRTSETELSRLLFLGFSPPTSSSEKSFSTNIKSRKSVSVLTKRISDHRNVKDITNRLLVNPSPSVSLKSIHEATKQKRSDSIQEGFLCETPEITADQRKCNLKSKEHINIETPNLSVAQQGGDLISPIACVSQIKAKKDGHKGANQDLPNLHQTPEYLQGCPEPCDVTEFGDGQSTEPKFRFVGPCTFYASNANAFLVPRLDSNGGHNVLLHLSQGEDWPVAKVMVEPPHQKPSCPPRVLSHNGYIHVVFGQLSNVEEKVGGAQNERQFTPICENSVQTDALPLKHRLVQTEKAPESRHQSPQTLQTPANSQIGLGSLRRAAADSFRAAQHEKDEFSNYEHHRELVDRAYTNNLLEMCTSLILGEMCSRHRPPDSQATRQKNKSNRTKDKQCSIHSDDESSRTECAKSTKTNSKTVQCNTYYVSPRHSLIQPNSLIALNKNTTGCKISDSSNTEPKLDDSDNTVCSGAMQGGNSFGSNTDSSSVLGSTRCETPTTLTETEHTLSLGQEEYTVNSVDNASEMRLLEKRKREKYEHNAPTSVLTAASCSRQEVRPDCIDVSDRLTELTSSCLSDRFKGTVTMEENWEANKAIKTSSQSHSYRSSLEKKHSFPFINYKNQSEDAALVRVKSYPSQQHHQQQQQKQQQRYKQKPKPCASIANDISESLAYRVRLCAEEPDKETGSERDTSRNRRESVGSQDRIPPDSKSAVSGRQNTNSCKPGGLSLSIASCRSKALYPHIATTSEDSSISKAAFSPPPRDGSPKKYNNKTVPFKCSDAQPPKYTYVVRSSDDEIFVHKRKQHAENGLRNKLGPSTELRPSSDQVDRRRETLARAKERLTKCGSTGRIKHKRKKFPYPGKAIMFTSSPSSSTTEDDVEVAKPAYCRLFKSRPARESSEDIVKKTELATSSKRQNREEFLPVSQRWAGNSSVKPYSSSSRRPSLERYGCRAEKNFQQHQSRLSQQREDYKECLPISSPTENKFKHQRATMVTTPQHQRETLMGSGTSRALNHQNPARQRLDETRDQQRCYPLFSSLLQQQQQQQQLQRQIPTSTVRQFLRDRAPPSLSPGHIVIRPGQRQLSNEDSRYKTSKQQRVRFSDHVTEFCHNGSNNRRSPNRPDGVLTSLDQMEPRCPPSEGKVSKRRPRGNRRGEVKSPSSTFAVGWVTEPRQPKLPSSGADSQCLAEGEASISGHAPRGLECSTDLSSSTSCAHPQHGGGRGIRCSDKEKLDSGYSTPSTLSKGQVSHSSVASLNEWDKAIRRKLKKRLSHFL
ncbi:hypothetical protein RRG08_024655 [Elysia crispata]|uniref:Uncharacterized protein n=1 Tax=Elysia crispata TaxID=231223 RepID=A0AAE0ZX12_9GAST|nr:hypothetical protein RRG08_024655 [Elysia crispata]